MIPQTPVSTLIYKFRRPFACQLANLGIFACRNPYRQGAANNENDQAERRLVSVWSVMPPFAPEELKITFEIHYMNRQAGPYVAGIIAGPARS
jgi:hypothetical protein